MGCFCPGLHQLISVWRCTSVIQVLLKYVQILLKAGRRILTCETKKHQTVNRRSINSIYWKHNYLSKFLPRYQYIQHQTMAFNHYKRVHKRLNACKCQHTVGTARCPDKSSFHFLSVQSCTPLMDRLHVSFSSSTAIPSSLSLSRSLSNYCSSLVTAPVAAGFRGLDARTPVLPLCLVLYPLIFSEQKRI